jgi:cell division septum initiation protein DivIVA
VSTFQIQDGPDAEAMIRRVIDIIESTRTLPLSSSVKLDNREEVLELLEDALARLPQDLRQARWMLKEREEYLGKMQREGEDILQAARQRAERMVQRTEIVREANHTARDIIEAARDEARRLRLESEDYADQKLAAFEIVLERTLKTVAAGRQKLAATPVSPASERSNGTVAGATDDTIVATEAFFDQDQFE